MLVDAVPSFRSAGKVFLTKTGTNQTHGDCVLHGIRSWLYLADSKEIVTSADIQVIPLPLRGKAS